MAKMSDLNLDADAEPGEDSSIEEFLTVIEGMRGSGKYEWCDGTLTGIYDTVHKSRRVSEGQRRAVVNFLHSREEDMGDYE